MTPDQARLMASKIKQVDTLNSLAQQEINLTGGEATQNPHIVEITKIFQSASPSVCVHTNLEINSKSSKRWLRLIEIVKGGGRVDITLYPTAWEKFQKPLLKELITLQNRMIINLIFENLIHLQEQIQLLKEFFSTEEQDFKHVVKLLHEYNEKVSWLVKNQAECDDKIYESHMGGTEAFAHGGNFTLGLSLLPAFRVDTEGKRSMTSIPFPQNPYIIHCPAARGSIDIMTILQTGEMTPCCDVGNLKCQPKFGNLLTDSPKEIMEKFEESSKVMAIGISKNQENLKNENLGKLVKEGIPPYCG
jgi:organic radical activating enzyme